jgi:hypothetical protein
LSHALSLSTATYIDIDYDTISGALVINGGWPSAPDEEGWSDKTSRKESDGTVEIGVLMHELNPDPEDIQFGGFLTVLGEDKSPSTLPAPMYISTQLLTAPQNPSDSKHPHATTPFSPHPPLPKNHRQRTP